MYHNPVPTVSERLAELEKLMEEKGAKEEGISIRWSVPSALACFEIFPRTRATQPHVNITSQRPQSSPTLLANAKVSKRIFAYDSHSDCS
jgi:hypothetical protein